MTCTSYLLDQPGGHFTPVEEALPPLRRGEILLRTRRVSVCQSDVVIHNGPAPDQAPS